MGQDQKIPPVNNPSQRQVTMQKNGVLYKQAKELILSEELFRYTFENASIGMAIEMADGTFALTNAAFDRMMGYEPEGLIGIHRSVVTPPEDVVQDEERYRRFLETGLPNMSYEKRYMRKDGRVIWVDMNVSCIRDADGTAKSSIIMARDITEHNQMEVALRENEEKYHSLLEHAYDAIIIADFDGNLLEVNKKVEELLGCTKEELLGTNFSKLHPEEELGRVLPAFREMVEGKIHSLLDTKVLRKDGKTVPVDITGGAIRYGGRHVAQAIFRDITDRKEKEEALKQSEHRFRSLSEASLEAIVFIEDGVIVDANEALNRLFGYEGEDLRGKLASEFIAPERRLFTDERIRTRTVGAYETLGLRKDGSTFPIEVNPREFEQDGKNLRLSAVRDLTERYKLEKQLKDYQDHLEKLVAERTNAVKESERKYRNIFENAVVGIYQSTPEGRFLKANAALAQMYGYEGPEELIKSVTNIETDIYADPGCRKDFMALTERDGIVRNFEIQARTRDGLKKYVSVNAHAVKNESGKTLYYEGIIEDITEKKLVSDQLMAQRDLALKLAQIDKLEEGLAVILQTAINASGMELGGVSLKNPETSSFDLTFSIGLSDEFFEEIRHIMPGTNNWSHMMAGMVLHICPSQELTPLAHKEGFKHISIVPILRNEEAIGALVVATKVLKNIPDQTQIGLEYLAAEIGNIVARMQTRQRLDEEISIRMQTDKALMSEHQSLQEANTALKVLLKHREDDKKELEEKLVSNVRHLVLPYVEKLKESHIDPVQQMSVSLIESNLNEILSSFLHTIQCFKLTPRQLEVVALIREGKTSKEIAGLLNVSKQAVDIQRFMIRKKLGLNKSKTNLQSHLKSLL
jgi:PAS domain S-box-containing protein